MHCTMPLLACFSGSYGRGLHTIIYVIIGCWIITLTLGCVNFILICLKGDRCFQLLHFSWFTIYAGALAALRWPVIPDNLMAIASAFGLGIPICVAIHFVALLRKRT
jgi:hypothetical protein